MISLRKRLGASIALTLLSLGSIVLLLPRDSVTRLQKITLGLQVDTYSDLWRWDEADSGGGAAEGVRLVVFGDSWVSDNVEKGVEGRGKSWPEVLCEELNCTSRLSFSATQPASVYLEHAPIGVYTSRIVHEWADGRSQPRLNDSIDASALPDLAQQIQTYLALPAHKGAPQDTIFAFSLGFWDVYDFARLDFEVAKNATDASIKYFYAELEILYDHFVKHLSPPTSNVNSTHIPADSQFKVILPKVFDPTLAPGWSTLRSAVMKPSSVAEEQKNAVYLTQRWNQQLENSLGPWLDSHTERSVVQEPPVVIEGSVPIAGADTSTILSSSAPESDSTPPEATPTAPSESDSSPLEPEPEPFTSTRVIPKSAFLYDVSQPILDLLIEYYLESQSLVDATGLGNGSSPFISATVPCLHLAADGEELSGVPDLNGLLRCGEPDAFLWWDAWNVGGVVNAVIGRGVAEKVLEGKSLRSVGEKDYGM